MKIAYIIGFKENFGGGEGQISWEISKKTSERHQALLICPGNKYSIKKDTPNLSIFRYKSFGKDDLSLNLLTISDTRRLLKQLTKFNPDIVHCQTPLPIGLVGQLWCKMNQKPFVFTLHVLMSKPLDFGVNEVVNLKPIVKNTIQEYIKTSVKKADGVIALNQAAKDDLAKFLPKQKIFEVPNGRNLDMYNKLKIADISSQQKNLIFIGFINHRKNQEYLIDTMKYLPSNYSLNLVGDSNSPQYLEKLKRKIKKLKLKNIHFLGQVEYSEIPKLLEKSHLFISASKMEVQCLSMIEALASGTPIIGLENETIKELVNTNVGISLNSNTPPEKFAEYIKNICNKTPKEYIQICKNARESVKKFNWDNVITQNEKVYQELIDRKNFSNDKDPSEIDDIIRIIPGKKIRNFIQSEIHKVSKLPSKASNTAPTLVLIGLASVVTIVTLIALKISGKDKTIRSN